MHSILILGGYGFFGGRIRLLIAGRDLAQAQGTAIALGLGADHGISIDARDANLAQQFTRLRIDTVIHTAGPFQAQDYAVARAAISAGANYIDLADGRAFVAGIAALDQMARQRGVLVTSGASSLPALSSAVVDHYQGRFKQLSAIRMGIGSGARAPGLATLRGVFGYCGKPFTQLGAGAWQTKHGWLQLQRHVFPAPVGARWLGSCDVPDLELFARRYPGVHTVHFKAGYASAGGHLLVWAASQLVRLGLLRSLVPFAAPLHTVSQLLEPLLSDKGGMYVAMAGIGANDQPLELVWHLMARQNHGPIIPCGAAIALARKLAQVNPLPYVNKLPSGAMPCMGLLSVSEYLSALVGFDVYEIAP
jgi:saccharopine dehydrogenase-like NADP-dependent oxidoreductase